MCYIPKIQVMTIKHYNGDILKFYNAKYPHILHPFKQQWYQMILFPQWYRIHPFCPKHVSLESD